MKRVWRLITCWLRRGGEHDYEVEFEGQAHVLVLRCRSCEHHSVGWG